MRCFLHTYVLHLLSFPLFPFCLIFFRSAFFVFLSCSLKRCGCCCFLPLSLLLLAPLIGTATTNKLNDKKNTGRVLRTTPQLAMKRFFNSFYSRTGIITDPGQRSVASRVSALALEGVIVFTALGTLGVDTSPLIAAAGITGATIGFACKDFGANFVASIALSGQQALRTGNKVSIGVGSTMVSGTIVDWDTRYLYLRNDDQAIVCVPNNVILNSVVMWKDVKPTAKGAATDDPLAKDNKEWKAAASAAGTQAK